MEARKRGKWEVGNVGGQWQAEWEGGVVAMPKESPKTIVTLSKGKQID